MKLCIFQKRVVEIGGGVIKVNYFEFCMKNIGVYIENR